MDSSNTEDAEDAGGSKASVSRRKGGGKRKECGGEELGLHGKLLLRYIQRKVEKIIK
jgi:hypothetical protein